MSDPKRILLVDDDAEFTDGVQQLLEAEGFEVQAAHDGKQGIEAARAMRPDLILLDVMMTTDTEGFDVSRKIQEEDQLRGTPVILMTGIKSAMNLPFQFEPDDDWLPVKEVLEKPVPPERLLEAVKKHLGIG